MSLKLLQKPDLEPVILNEVKAFLHIEHELDDGLLTTLITTVREFVERFLGRSLIKQKWQYKNRLEGCGNSDRLNSVGITEGYPFGINLKITLPNSPISEVTELVCNGTKVQESDFKLGTVDEREILSLQTKQAVSTGPIEVSVEYIAGYGEQAEDVPSTIRLAIIMLVGKIYKDRDLMFNEQEALNGVKHLLCPYRLSQM